MKPLSLTARISLLFACCASLVLLGLGWMVVRSVEAHFMERDRHEIEGKLSLVRNLLAKAGNMDGLDALPAQLDNALVGHEGLSIALIASDGSIWFVSRGQDYPQAMLRQPGNAGLTIWTARKRTWRGLTAPASANFEGAPRFTVAIALDITQHRAFMREFLTLLGLATALAALATATLGWLATRTGLTPLKRMTALATRLSASRLNERIPESPLPPEIRTLAIAFNAMLDRLSGSFERLSAFAADLAHEMRTPVNTLMMQTQVMLTQARTADEYRDVLASNLEEYERLARTIGDMLFLAKADNGLIVPTREPVELAEEIRDLFEFYEALAEDRHIKLVCSGAATINGDRLMLRRALSNLLSNGIRHAPESSTVSVTLNTAGDEVTLTFDNPCANMDQHHLDHLFDRFYRIDPARRDTGEGAGLGLAITRSIAQAHGGDVKALRIPGGIRFELRLPKTVE